MMHFISDPSLKRPGYVYHGNVGYPICNQPRVDWKHADGPLLHCSAGRLHWLTRCERLRLFYGLADIHDIDFERRKIA
ncbi:hypothetical protein MA20_32125 [Bradyrhizobium japonicum]|uniref:Transposase n=1 Tax=Bradyrhizobium japonicum TaxID=375 RepID=A0A0A3XN51_BRAJP|nr:hypothetical protein [Bradyrhizobium japonicum]KGT75837.1 hypothetical protein MA20_32125 [Bradyrhizobium japonicum]